MGAKMEKKLHMFYLVDVAAMNATDEEPCMTCTSSRVVITPSGLRQSTQALFGASEDGTYFAIYISTGEKAHQMETTHARTRSFPCGTQSNEKCCPLVVCFHNQSTRAFVST